MFKEVVCFGRNLPDNWSRLQALDACRQYLLQAGKNKAEIEERINHEKEHLNAFPDYDPRSGKKLKLVLERDGKNTRLAIKANRKHLGKDVRRSVLNVNEPSDGDRSYNCFARFRKR